MKMLPRNSWVPLGLALSVILTIAVSPTASGAQPTVVPNITLDAPGLGVAFTHTPEKAAFQLASDGKRWELKPNGQFVVPGASWLTVQELRFDPDPLVYNSILVQNNTLVNQIYTIGVTLPTVWGAPSLIRGSIDTSLIGTDGQVSALANSSIYAAQIDLSTVKTLQAFPFTLSTPQPAISSSAQFGFELNNIPVTSSMGILLRFQLSPGDTATLISDFEIIAVPEPGMLSLLTLGGGLLVWRRQRK